MFLDFSAQLELGRISASYSTKESLIELYIAHTLVNKREWRPPTLLIAIAIWTTTTGSHLQVCSYPTVSGRNKANLTSRRSAVSQVCSPTRPSQLSYLGSPTEPTEAGCDNRSEPGMAEPEVLRAMEASALWRSSYSRDSWLGNHSTNPVAARAKHEWC